MRSGLGDPMEDFAPVVLEPRLRQSGRCQAEGRRTSVALTAPVPVLQLSASAAARANI